jgi:hypothetical protein
VVALGRFFPLGGPIVATVATVGFDSVKELEMFHQRQDFGKEAVDGMVRVLFQVRVILHYSLRGEGKELEVPTIHAFMPPKGA